MNTLNKYVNVGVKKSSKVLEMINKKKSVKMLDRLYKEHIKEFGEESVGYDPEGDEENQAWESGCIRGIEMSRNHLSYEKTNGENLKITLDKVFNRERKQMIENMKERTTLAEDYKGRYNTVGNNFTLKGSEEAFDNLDFDTEDAHTSYDQGYLKGIEDIKALIEKSL